MVARDPLHDISSDYYGLWELHRSYQPANQPFLGQQLFGSLSCLLCDRVQVKEDEGGKDEEDWRNGHH